MQSINQSINQINYLRLLLATLLALGQSLILAYNEKKKEYKLELTSPRHKNRNKKKEKKKGTYQQPCLIYVPV